MMLNQISSLDFQWLNMLQDPLPTQEELDILNDLSFETILAESNSELFSDVDERQIVNAVLAQVNFKSSLQHTDRSRQSMNSPIGM